MPDLFAAYAATQSVDGTRRLGRNCCFKGAMRWAGGALSCCFCCYCCRRHVICLISGGFGDAVIQVMLGHCMSFYSVRCANTILCRGGHVVSFQRHTVLQQTKATGRRQMTASRRQVSTATATHRHTTVGAGIDGPQLFLFRTSSLLFPVRRLRPAMSSLFEVTR